MPKASVRIMRSYDYNQFEVCLSTDENLTLKEANEMRKNVARLVDKAVDQYKTAMKNMDDNGIEKEQLRRDVEIINENFPKSKWTPEQKAKVQKLAEWTYYDYDDDWDK